MFKKLRFKTFLSVCVLSFVSTLSFGQTGRAKYNFNPAWKFVKGDVEGAQALNFDDSKWQAVTLPNAWNEDSAFKVLINNLPTGIAWYRKHFRLPKGSENKKVFIEFEGLRQAGEVYLNGEFIGRHEDGIMAFGFDLSNKLNYKGDNVIAVRVDNSWDYREKATNSRFQWSDRNFNANYGGINKNVWLHITNKLYQTLPLYSDLQTTGVYVYAQDFNIDAKTATVHVESEVKNETGKAQTFGFEVEVKDADGKVVKTFKGENQNIAAGATATVKALAPMQNLNFWSWGYGYLYTVTAKLTQNGKVTDEVPVVTGFRKTAFKNGMVYLNDRVLLMKGYAQRTTNEWPAVGQSVPAWLSDYSNHLMVESNANLVRWMHITPWKQDVESCDRVGLIQAMPAGDSEADVTGVRWEQRVKVMRDATIYNRNAPSILFYESGNESISEAHMAEMKAIRDKYDPHGGRAAGSREMLDSKVAEYGGEMLYINKSANIPMWATEYSRDEGLRKYWDEFSPPYHKDGDGPLYKNESAAVYNRNQDSHAIEDIVRWYDFWRERPGTGKRVSAGGVNIIFSDSNTHHRGAENYRRSGEVDAMRIPKDGFYAHQVMWDGWVDVEHFRAHIMGHWNYKAGVVKNIYVVASGEKTELFINGKSKGFGERSSDFLFTFKNIAWEPGTIKAVTYSKDGKVLAEDEIKTAGEPVALKLTAMTHPDGVKADGSDLILAQVEVVDKDGNRCPTALNMINFDLSGEATWRGGIAQGPDNYILSKNLPVEGGVNRVFIRASKNAGNIKLFAKSDGLQSAELNFKSVPVKVTDGLATVFPADGLKGKLERGPTPAGPSYKNIRKTLEIADITAGSNQSEARLSIDDNELSAWGNDGNLNTAWISYQFKDAARIDGVQLKLNNFRTRTYPIKISVDGNTVYEGVTARSLGYIDIPVKSTVGKSLKIELKALNSGKDDSNIQEEMGGKKLDDGIGGDDANKKGVLKIIEAEVYQNL